MFDRNTLLDSAPLAIARVAPRTVESIELLRRGALIRDIAELRSVREDVNAVKERVSAILHSAIGGCDEIQRRRTLIDARRRLYNGIALNHGHRIALAAVADASIGVQLAELEAISSRQREAVEAYERAYAAVQREERSMLASAAVDDALAKGIALSSESLFRALARSRHADGAIRPARRAQTERGLLRYLTRMVMKATPFGTLCHVIPVRRIVSDRDEPLSVSGDASRTKSALRLNKRLYGSIWLALRKRIAVRSVLRVRPAPTLERDGDWYVALAAIDQRETFQRVRATPMIDAVVDLIERKPHLRLAEVVQALVAGARFEADSDEITLYLERLIDLGLLQVCAVVSDQDAEWDVPLRKALTSVEDDTAQYVASALGRLRDAFESYRDASAEERAEVLRVMREEVKAIMLRLELENDGADTPLFEDATTLAECRLPLGPRLRATLETVARLGELVARLAPARVESATMRRFWEREYGQRDSVPLLEFYRDYYKAVKKDLVSARQNVAMSASAQELYNSEFAQQLKRAASSLRALIANAWRIAPMAVEVVIAFDAVEKAVAHAPRRGDDAPSLACFAQVTWEVNRPRIVMRRWAMQTGHGKYFSRFFDVLPPEVLAAVRRRNGSAWCARHVEVMGDAFFNANLHPTLLSGSIAYPTSDTEAPVDAIAVHLLDVMPNASDPNTLVVRDRRTGRVVVPVDLGFLAGNLRPPLYQLLVSLGNAPDVSFDWPDRLPPLIGVDAAADARRTPDVEGQQQAKSPPVITYRPRIVLANALVVARRRWCVPAECVPCRERGERDAAFFMRIDSWRIVSGIPVEVYVAVRQSPVATAGRADARKSLDPKRFTEVAAGEYAEAEAEHSLSEHRADDGAAGAELAAENGSEENRRLISRDAWKPQYVHFGSPALVALFERISGGLEQFWLEIEERYPGDEALLKGSDGQYTYEFVMQFDGQMEGTRTPVVQAPAAVSSV